MAARIAPSIMCADLLNLGDTVRELDAAGVDYFHFDIMDGHFVPNLTLGPDIVSQVRTITQTPFDIHLMVERPEHFIGMFQLHPGDFVSIHQETAVHAQRILKQIKDAGARAAVALNPATLFHTLEYILPDIDMILLMMVNPGYAGQSLLPAVLKKITHLRQYLNDAGYGNIEIEVDGNVSFENAVKMRKAGADIFVAGSSSIFAKGMAFKDSIRLLRTCVGDIHIPEGAAVRLEKVADGWGPSIDFIKFR